jgi:hypothetical protein
MVVEQNPPAQREDWRSICTTRPRRSVKVLVVNLRRSVVVVSQRPFSWPY